MYLSILSIHWRSTIRHWKPLSGWSGRGSTKPLSQEKAKRKVNCHMTNARKRIREMKAIAGKEENRVTQGPKLSISWLCE